MSERKVLSKYYPPDFDPRQLQRRGPKATGPKVQTVRLMAPFSMRCTSCGEYIGKGRKFNARKSTPDEKYLGIQIFRFFIRCTRCSAEITFRTDPQTSDYICETGAKRNTEPWRIGNLAEETIDERLDRLEQEDLKQENNEKTTMEDLEKETHAAEVHMAVADALDEVRSRNARRERRNRDGFDAPTEDQAAIAEMEEKQDEEEARRAFATHARMETELSEEPMPPSPPLPPPPVLRDRPKRAQKHTKLLPGIKHAEASPAKNPLVDYGSDSD